MLDEAFVNARESYRQAGGGDEERPNCIGVDASPFRTEASSTALGAKAAANSSVPLLRAIVLHSVLG
jgi:hypothetical protein